jgi:Siphovirus Gp157.
MAKRKVKSEVVEPKQEPQQEQKPTPEQQLAIREKRELSLDDYREEIANVEAMIGEGGELTEEQADQLVALHAGSIMKMKSLVWVIRRIDDSCELGKKEIERINNLIAYRKKASDKLSEALLRHILATQPEKKKIDLDTYIISAHKCPPSVQVADGFNDPFLSNIKGIKNPSPETIDAARANGDVLDIQPDKAAIKEALLAGQDVPGAELIDNKYRLVIK